MKNKSISVIQIARELGTKRQDVFKLLDQLGIEKSLQKSTSPRGPKIAYITTAEYARVKGYVLGDSTDPSDATIDPDSGGVFFLIQLEPEHDPDRFKLGFATDLEEELSAAKATAPYSTVLQTWPCKLLWEETAIECAAQDCEMIHAEVFRSDSIANVMGRCDQLFALLPEIDNERESED